MGIWVLIISAFGFLDQVPFCPQFALLNHVEEINFLISELRMPEINDEVDPCLRAIMPYLMVEGLVKYDALILLEVDSLFSNSYLSTFDSKQGQVNTELLIHRTIVSKDVSTRCHSTEIDLVIDPRYQMLYYLNCLGYFRSVIFEWDVMKENVKDVPLAFVKGFKIYKVLW